MYKKHLSDKIAKVFVAAGILFLIPGALGVLPAILIMLVGLFAMQGEVFLFGLFSVSIFAIGIILLIGYSKHSSGSLDESKILPLWFATLVYNGSPLFITLLILILKDEYREKAAENFGFFTLAILCWWIIAACLSLTAIYDEFERSKS